jgi:hypothetical protein
MHLVDVDRISTATRSRIIARTHDVTISETKLSESCVAKTVEAAHKAEKLRTCDVPAKLEAHFWRHRQLILFWNKFVVLESNT